MSPARWWTVVGLPVVALFAALTGPVEIVCVSLMFVYGLWVVRELSTP
ncbi:hypothetical protein ACFYOT_26425 [Saccharothrix saharensis]